MSAAFSRAPKPEKKYKCSERMEQVIKAARSSRLVRKDPLEGKWQNLVYSSAKTVQAKRDVAATNSIKEKTLTEKRAQEKASNDVAQLINLPNEKETAEGRKKLKQDANAQTGLSNGPKRGYSRRKSAKEVKFDFPTASPMPSCPINRGNFHQTHRLDPRSAKRKVLHKPNQSLDQSAN